MTNHTLANYQAAQLLHARAREIRGRFLNHVATIEHDIAQLLVDYFCRDDSAKRQLFFEEIACRFTLDAKRKLLREIVKADYPRYWDENKQILADLQEIQSFRNKLAHSILNVSDEALARPIEEGVGFVQWNGGSPITQQHLDDWCARANMITSTLLEIKGLLPYKERS